MDWILSLLLGSHSPLEAIKVLGIMKNTFVLIFLIALVGLIFIPPILEAGFRSSIILGLLIIIIWAAFIIGGGYMGLSVIPAWEQQMQDLRPHYFTSATEFNTSEYQSIASLNDGQSFSMSGHGSAGFAFFLGFGSMSINGQTTPEYIFYKVTGNESYMLDTLPAAGVTIREDGGNNPRIEKVYHHSVTAKIVYTDDNETSGGDESMCQTGMFIHVPKGTIIRNYRLDSNLGG